LADAILKRLMGPIPGKDLPQRVLYKQNLFIPGRITQIPSKNNFFLLFGNANLSVTRCHLADKPKELRPAPLDNDEPEEELRSHAHTTAGHGKKLWPPL
jgi:hypothetical protein